LSDENKEVVQLYDVWKKESMYVRKYLGVERTTFVIEKKARFKKYFRK